MPHASTEPTHHAQHQPDAESTADILELESEVLAEHIATITAWLPVATNPRQIMDLGCGTGAGTLALLRRFPQADVIAVDASASNLQRLRQQAAANGVSHRVSTVQADLDADWPDFGRPELVWASASMHHLADPDRILRKVHDLLATGGLFAVVELGDFPRFLPPDAPEFRPGLEERCHAALAHQLAEQMPHRGADWAAKLTAAGFSVEAERVFGVSVEGAHNPAVGRYALGTLSRLRHSAAHALDAQDLTALDKLLDTNGPRSILRRSDLALCTERTVSAARRI